MLMSACGCMLAPGDTGVLQCQGRITGDAGRLNYGKVTSLHMNPIEKPLYHFFPGNKLLSANWLGAASCRLVLNAGISQAGAITFRGCRLPRRTACHVGKGNRGHRPCLPATNRSWFECTYWKQLHLSMTWAKNVMVTSGYVEPVPL